MQKRKGTIGLLVASMMMFSGCGTIMNGTGTMVNISSVPRADVTIDGKKYGKTPISVKLGNKEDHHVQMVADGYQPYDTTIKSNLSGWAFGNLILGIPGLLGVLVDMGTGGTRYLTPEKMNPGLAKISEKGFDQKLMNKTVVVK